MDIETFHFDQSFWLWGLIIIPIVWSLFFLFYRGDHSTHFESMIDKHLLPFLLINQKSARKPWKLKLLSWSILWGCLILALAGPRWSFRDVEMITKNQNLIIALDLSDSMNATDVKPSRLIRAKQKIEDLLQYSQGVKIGLIAFAADSHMITPLTDDKETIRHLLPSLSTDLVYIQGSRLSPVLKMASKMLEGGSDHHQALVIISDGGFEDQSAITDIKKFAEKNIAVHTIGIGTLEGTALQGSKNSIKKNKQSAFSKLERESLVEISKAGQGFYIEPGYTPYNETNILDQLQRSTETTYTKKHMRLWDEGFLFFLLPSIFFFFYWFRKGVILASILAILTIPSYIQAESLQDYFLNSEEIAAKSFQETDYKTAAQTFKDPYRKGIAYYKAGQFQEAEDMFKQCDREDLTRNAGYNLGNTFVQQQKYQEAINTYEEVLKKYPDHIPTKDNLELVKKLLKQQNQEQNDNKDQQDNEEESSNEENNKNSSKGQKKKSDTQDETSNEENSKEEEENTSFEEESQEENDSKHDEQSDLKEPSQDQTNPQTPQKSEQDQDADMWLNRLKNDPEKFLKNKFFIESKKNETREGIDPW